MATVHVAVSGFTLRADKIVQSLESALTNAIFSNEHYLAYIVDCCQHFSVSFGPMFNKILLEELFCVFKPKSKLADMLLQNVLMLS